jgi:hypothetical protein
MDCENKWRAENCPWAEDLWCSCPYDVVTCDIARTCDELNNDAYATWATLNVNGDSKIDLGDENGSNNDDIYYLLRDCDFNDNSSVDFCEFYECYEAAEN